MYPRPDLLSFVRTRFAPTPSGYLHLGNILSFVLTAGMARATGARILLRIDDLDQERVRSEYLQDIFDTLNFLGLPWDEGPEDPADFTAHWSQQHRVHLYAAALEQVAMLPQVFACTCSRAHILRQSGDGGYPGTCRNRQLPLDTAGAAWRLATPNPLQLHVPGLCGPQLVPTLPPALRDFVVRKKDGVAAYQLASVTDDLHFGIDLVVRGADLWPSTSAQLYLASLLGKQAFGNTVFVHHALVRDGQGAKLSKSAGATSVYHLRRQGKTPADVFQTLAAWCGIDTPVADWQSLYAALQKNEAALLQTITPAQ